jgi:hypothetical protein
MIIKTETVHTARPEYFITELYIYLKIYREYCALKETIPSDR